MKLAIMTKSTFFVEEDKILAALFDVGLDNLHLYKPETLFRATIVAAAR